MENDLISRAKLIEEMESHIYWGDSVIGLLEVAKNAPSVEAEPRWISVKDGLPEKTGMYLAHLVHSYSNEDEYSCVTVCFFDLNARPKWAIEGRLYKVTHWMPLPKPPEEDEQ